MARGRRYKRKQSKSRRATRWLLVVGILALAALVAVICVERHRTVHSHIEIDREAYPVIGIDVSRNNGRIDFEKVHDHGIAFVFIKSSEGVTFRDVTFKRHALQARKAGLKVGAYHFFRKSLDGKRQAQNFLNAIGGTSLDMPLAIDVEDWNNDKRVPDRLVIERLRSMVNYLQGKHCKVMIYTNVHGYRKWIERHFSSLQLWICSFTPPEKMTIEHRIQQYSHWGTVDGVKGEVDLNVFNGSRAHWEQWLEGMAR